MITSGTIVLGTNILSCIYLWWLERLNEKRHRNSLYNPNRYSLSERFQLNENIKTAFIIRRVIFLIVILNILIGALIPYSFWSLTELSKKCAYYCFQIVFNFYRYSVPIVGMTANRLWITKFKR